MKLEIGYKHSFEIRRELVRANVKNNFSLLFLSDLHFNRFSGKLVLELTETISRLNPDLILLGGDYSDGPKGFFWLKNLFDFLRTRKNVFAIAGNHDLFFGKEKIKTLALSNNIVWLENRTFETKIKNCRIAVGNDPLANYESEFNVLCLHQPKSPEKLPGHFHLVLAGHLHGCQFVFWQNEEGMYPGKYFYSNNFLKKQKGSSVYLNSKGLGDTLPLRYNCKKDIIFVEVIA